MSQDVPDVPGVPDVPDVPDVPGLPDVPGVPDVPDVPGVPGVPDVPGVPGVLGVRDVPRGRPGRAQAWQLDTWKAHITPILHNMPVMEEQCLLWQDSYMPQNPYLEIRGRLRILLGLLQTF